MATSPSAAWHEFEREDPELAALGSERFNSDLPSFLATVRGEMAPRVHPVDARVKNGHLAVYMYATSPKCKDLTEDGRFALHCGVADRRGGAGEFHVRGRATRVETEAHVRKLTDAGLPSLEGYVLWELGIDEAFACTYGDDSDEPMTRRWRRRQR